MIVFSAESSGSQTYSAAPPAFAERTIFQPPPPLYPTSTNSQIRLQNSQRYFHEKLQKNHKSVWALPPIFVNHCH